MITVDPRLCTTNMSIKLLGKLITHLKFAISNKKLGNINEGNFLNDASSDLAGTPNDKKI